MGDNLQFGELELLLRWEIYTSTERERENPTETPTTLHRELARVGALNPQTKGEEQQDEDPPPHPKKCLGAG